MKHAIIILAIIALVLTCGCIQNGLKETQLPTTTTKDSDYICGPKTILYYNNTMGFIGYGHGEGSIENWNKTSVFCNETICTETITPFGTILDDGTLVCNRSELSPEKGRW